MATRVVAACALVVASAACQRKAPAPKLAPDAAAAATPVAAPDPDRLPEDPEAGRRSTLQWREHLDEEEKERQLAFDARRVEQHKALIRSIVQLRERYDRARSEAAVAKLQVAAPRSIAELQKRVTEIDHWGVNSRLLPDYAALFEVLGSAYAEAKLAALAGQPEALGRSSAEFDARLARMGDWLSEAAESEEEQEEQQHERAIR